MSIDIIKTLSLVLPQCADALTPGHLEVQANQVDTNDAAGEAVRAFGGSGWVVYAKNPDVKRISERNPIQAAESGSGWILQAELANGDKSLHIHFAAGKWHLTTVTQTATAPSESLLVRTSLLFRDQEDSMIYETCWSAQECAGIPQLIPTAYRFVGFKEN